MRNIRAAIYARVSSQRQADEHTVDSQLADLQQRIDHDQLTVPEGLQFIDEAYSGAVLQRPALERLRDQIYASTIDRLYVHSPDRLARKYVYQMVLLEEFQRHDCEVVFLNHNVDQQTPESALMLQMQGMIAEYERAKILERTRRGRRHSARQGNVSVFGRAPYGYRYVRKDSDGEARWEVDLEQAEVVKRIFHWVGQEGVTLANVSRRLYEAQIPTATGKPRWDHGTILGMLRNPAYCGQAKYGKTRLIPRNSTRRSKRGDPKIPRQTKVARPTTPEEQETISVPALVSCELFDAVAKRLEKNRYQQRERQVGGMHFLSGFLVCGECGSAYCGRRQRGGKYTYYRCIGTDKYRRHGVALCTNRSVKGELLDRTVWGDVCQLLQNPDHLRRQLERQRDTSPKTAQHAAEQEALVAKLRNRLDRLINAYMDGLVEREEFEPRVRRLRDQLTRAEDSLLHTKACLAGGTTQAAIAKAFQQLMQQVATSLETSDTSTRREIMKFLIDEIQIGREEINIVYKVPTHPFEPRPASDASRGNFLQHRLRRHAVAPRLRNRRSSRLILSFHPSIVVAPVFHQRPCSCGW